jgi:uncharacterized short protein YbdD (DUF466 family)
MGNFTMTCTCGDAMTIEAVSREEAVKKLQGMMTADAVALHMAQKHPGQPVMPVSEAHAMIARNLQPA